MFNASIYSTSCKTRLGYARIASYARIANYARIADQSVFLFVFLLDNQPNSNVLSKENARREIILELQLPSMTMIASTTATNSKAASGSPIDL
jgi:hypothetical protein